MTTNWVIQLWRHQVETFSALLALCAGISPVTGECPSQRSVTRSFDVFFDLRLGKWLSKQSRRLWFETSWHSLWRHCNARLWVQTMIYVLHWIFSALSATSSNYSLCLAILICLFCFNMIRNVLWNAFRYILIFGMINLHCEKQCNIILCFKPELNNYITHELCGICTHVLVLITRPYLGTTRVCQTVYLILACN